MTGHSIFSIIGMPPARPIPIPRLKVIRGIRDAKKLLKLREKLCPTLCACASTSLKKMRVPLSGNGIFGAGGGRSIGPLGKPCAVADLLKSTLLLGRSKFGGI